MKDILKGLAYIFSSIFVCATIAVIVIIIIDEISRYMCVSSFKDYYPVRYNYYLGCQIKPDDKWENVANGAN